MSLGKPVVPKKKDDEDVEVVAEVVGAKILDVVGVNELDFEKVVGNKLLEVVENDEDKLEKSWLVLEGVEGVLAEKMLVFDEV